MKLHTLLEVELKVPNGEEGFLEEAQGELKEVQEEVTGELKEAQEEVKGELKEVQEEDQGELKGV